MAVLDFKKKMNLKLKKEKGLSTIYDTGNPLWFSGFCLTDNRNFSEFFLNRVPRLGFVFKKFAFDSNDLSYKLGREVQPEEKKDKILFDKWYTDKLYYLHFERYRERKHFFLSEFMNKQVHGVVGIINRNKLVGILITKKENYNGI